MKIDAKRLAVQIATGTADMRALEAAGVEAVRAAKESLEVPFLRMARAATSSVNEETRTIRYVWSDETVDRYGDIIRADGWDTAAFDGNPIALWMHNMDEPIGRGVDYGVEGTALVGGIKFAPQGASQRSDEAWALAKAGVLQAVSVGFDPLERVWHDDEEKRAAMGLGKFGVEYLRQSLLEISLVSIPANPSALQLALRPLIDSGELSDRAADRLTNQLTERDWEKRARAIRRRSVVVDAKPGASGEDTNAALLARIDSLEHEVRRLGVLAIGTRASDGARERAAADEADARAALEALLRASEERSVSAALGSLISANEGARK